MKRAVLALGLAMVATIGVAAPGNASASADAPPSRVSAALTTSYFAGGFQFGTSDGAMVTTLDTFSLIVGPGAIGSAAFLAVESADQQQVIEVGYHVRPGLYGDTLPHLFIAIWVNNVFQCFNLGCGFVQHHPSLDPGMSFGGGFELQPMIQHFQGNWWIGNRFDWMGFFPDSRWNNTFTKAGLVQWLGQVQTDGSAPCATMGNSVPPPSANTAAFHEVAYFNGPSVSLGVTETNHALYGAAIVGTNNIHYGGRGVC
jgi:hypothetical protein